MELVATRLAPQSGELWAEAWQLYEAAFPRVERRDWSWHVAAMAAEPAFVCLHVRDAAGFVGLVFYWLFPQCVYVEHLAIAARRRGQGLGKQVLAMAQQYALPVMLEIEPVCDDTTARRLAFYERCGYHRLPCEHYQLPYRAAEPPLRLELLSYPVPADAALVAGFEQCYANGPMRYRQLSSCAE